MATWVAMMNEWAENSLGIQKQVEGLDRPVIVIDAAKVAMKELDDYHTPKPQNPMRFKGICVCE